MSRARARACVSVCVCAWHKGAHLISNCSKSHAEFVDVTVGHCALYKAVKQCIEPLPLPSALSVQSTSVLGTIGSSGLYDGRFSSYLSVCSAEDHCEHFLRGQGCPLFDVVHPTFPLPTTAVPNQNKTKIDPLAIMLAPLNADKSMRLVLVSGLHVYPHWRRAVMQ